MARNVGLCCAIHYDILNYCRKEMIHILQQNKKSYWHYPVEPTENQERINYFFFLTVTGSISPQASIFSLK